MLDRLFKYWSIGVLPVMAVFALSYLIAMVPNLGVILAALALFVLMPTFVGNIIVFEKERKERINARLSKQK